MNARLAALADALENVARSRDEGDDSGDDWWKDANACREAAAILRALAEQEPVAYCDITEWLRGAMPEDCFSRFPDDGSPLYTHPKAAYE